MTYRLVHIDILEHPVLRGTGKRRREYSDTEAFIWLIHQARRKPGKVKLEAGEIALAEGELCHSFRFMKDAWNWSLGRVQSFLERLVRNDMVNTRTDTGRLVISLCNFRKFQQPPRERNTRSNTVEKVVPIHSQYENQQERNRKKNNVDETRGVGAEGGLGETSFPTPAHPFALPGQLDLLKDQAPEAVTDVTSAVVTQIGAFIVDPDPVVPAPEPDPVVLDPVPPEPAAPELAPPSVVITATFQPVPFTLPPPDVPPIPPDNVVQITAHKGKPKKGDPGRRWGPDEEVPPDWIEAGHRVRFQNGLPWADLEAEARRFARHWTSPDAKNALKKDWKTTWIKWVDKPLQRNSQGFQGVYNEQRHHASAQGQRPQKRDAAMGALAYYLEIPDEDPEDPGFWN